MSGMTPPSLAQWQALLQRSVLAQARPTAAPDADFSARLQIYVDAYPARLSDVLGNDYPALKTLLGPPRFTQLCRDYLADHPSDRPSVRDVGRHLPRWLQTRAGLPERAAELAAFEWAQREIFDAADDAPLLIDEVSACSAAQWPSLVLRCRAATRVLSVHEEIPSLVAEAPRRGEMAQLAARATTPRSWLLWRQADAVHWRALDADEAPLMPLLIAGVSFGELCATLATMLSPDEVPSRAASLLKRWLSDAVLLRTALPTASAS